MSVHDTVIRFTYELIILFKSHASYKAYYNLQIYISYKC